ncbi:hypothetical protein ACRAWD_20510 [Caulobacter segnis]
MTIGARYTKDEARYENGSAVIGDYDFRPIVPDGGRARATSAARDAAGEQGPGRASRGERQAPARPSSTPATTAAIGAGTFSELRLSGSLRKSPSCGPRRSTPTKPARKRSLRGRRAQSGGGGVLAMTIRTSRSKTRSAPWRFLRSAGSSTLKGAETRGDVAAGDGDVVSLSGSVELHRQPL